MIEGDQRIALTVLWHGAELAVEERWTDTEDGKQETHYGFPGRKVEPDKEPLEAAIEDVRGKTGLGLAPNNLTGPEILKVGNNEGYVYQAGLPVGIGLEEQGFVIWTVQNLIDLRKSGKLMPLTNAFVEKHFLDGDIDN